MAISPDQEREIREAILDGLRPQPQAQVRIIRPTRIRVQGRFVRLANGKTLWNQPGHAKSAFTNYIANIAHYGIENDDITADMVEDVADQMIARGEVEFVELEAGEQPLQQTNARNNLK